MSFSEKRQEMVFTNRVERNITNYYQFIAILSGVKGYFTAGVNSDSGEDLFVEFGYSLWCSTQSFPIDVLTNSRQNQPYPFDYFLAINQLVVFCWRRGRTTLS